METRRKSRAWAPVQIKDALAVPTVQMEGANYASRDAAVARRACG